MLLTKGGRVQFRKQWLPESVARMRRPTDAFTEYRQVGKKYSTCMAIYFEVAAQHTSEIIEHVHNKVGRFSTGKCGYTK